MEKENFNKVIDLIEAIKLHDFSFANKYVDKGFWLPDLRKYFENKYIENLTSFDYSRCFTYLINLDDLNIGATSIEANKYIAENGVIFCLLIKISLFGPYLWYAYVKYYFSNEDKQIKADFRKKCFHREHEIVEEYLNKFIIDHEMIVLSDEILKKEIKDVKLELSGSVVTIENFLFDE